MKMLKINTLLFFTFLFGLNLSAQQKEWYIDPVFTSIEFEVQQVFFSKVKGEFEKYQSIVLTDIEDFTKTQIYITIKTNSLHTDNEERDTHLRSEDFFFVEYFPDMFFESTGVKEISTNNYELSGKLTILGITKELKLIMQFVNFGQDAHKRRMAEFVLTGDLLRSDFGMPGTVAVGNKVDINCKVRIVESKLK